MGSDKINKTEIEWMQEALRYAEQAEQEDEVPVGAVIVQKGSLLAVGYNRREHDQDPTLHAEIVAIREAAQRLGSWRLSDCELFVTLEPCPMCLAASQQARLSKITYGAIDPKGGALSLGYKLHEDKRTNHLFEVVSMPMLECGQILTRFFSKKRGKIS